MRITHGFRSLGTPHAVTIGNFDGLHLGHQAMLARLQDVARARGLPSCVLSFEPHPREFFTPEQAPARLSSLREKAECLQRHGHRPAARIPFRSRVFGAHRRGFHRAGAGHDAAGALRAGRRRFPLWRQARGRFRLAQAGRRERSASTPNSCPRSRSPASALRRPRCGRRSPPANSNMRRACWAGPTASRGRVVHGDKLGRDIGFPTANIQLKHNRPPLMGIFAVEVYGLNGAPLARRGEPGQAAHGERRGRRAGARSAPVRFQRRDLRPPRARGLSAQAARRREIPRPRHARCADPPRRRQRQTLL